MAPAGGHSGPQPGDFPIGSIESRAAARALAESRDESEPRLEWINDSIPRPERGPAQSPIPWVRTADGRLFRWVNVLGDHRVR